MIVISDFYYKSESQFDLNDFNSLQKAIYNIYRWLYENRILEKISFCYEENNDFVDFAFDVDDLIQYKNQILDLKIKNVDKGVEIIFNDNLPRCSFCGATSLLFPMKSFRTYCDHGQKVHIKVNQCYRCEQLKNKTVEHLLTQKDCNKSLVQKNWCNLKLVNSTGCRIGDCYVEYVQYIDSAHLHSLWYGGTVAKIHKDGYTFEIISSGDVKAVLTENKEHLEYVNDKHNNGEFYGIMRQYIADDDDLNDCIWRFQNFISSDSEIVPQGKMLDVVEQNTLSVVVYDKNGHEIQLNMDCLDSDLISEAIYETIEMIPKILDEIKEK